MDFGFWGLELRTEEKEEKGVTGDGVGDALKGEGKEFTAHGFIGIQG
jgi:hypothetical protein